MDALRRIVRALRLSAAEAERAGHITAAQLFVLQRLTEQPASSIAELAERTITDPSSVSAVLERLGNRGLIARKRSGEDGRRSEIALSRRGRALLERTQPAAQARLVEALASLPALDRRALARALSRLAEAMGASEQPPALFFADATPPLRKPRAARRPRHG